MLVGITLVNMHPYCSWYALRQMVSPSILRAASYGGDTVPVLYVNESLSISIAKV